MEQDDADSIETGESPEAFNFVVGRFGSRRPGDRWLPSPQGKMEEDTPAGEAIREWWRHLER